MKKRTKWIQGGLVTALICAALFVRLVVFPVGDNISLWWKWFSFRAGGTPEAWMLPKADTSDVGNTVTLDLVQMLDQVQFDDEDPLNGDKPERLCIAYIYNTKEDTGALAVINRRADKRSMCHLTIYKPEWTGGEALCENLQKPFYAQIIHRSNIDWEEGTHFFEAMLAGAKEDPSLIVDTKTYTPSDQASEIQCYYGIFAYCEGAGGELWTNIQFLLRDGVCAQLQLHELLPKEQRHKDVFLRIVEKYELNAYMMID